MKKLPPKKVIVRPKPRPKPMMAKHRGPQFGISAGYIAGIPGIQAEVRYHNPFDLLRTSIRIGGAYAQGNDTNQTMRKHALIVLDWIYRLNPPHAQGIRSYFGLGLNYNAYTTGQVSGSSGYQAYYGVEGGSRRGGQTYFEVGYGSIRTGFSPDYTSVTALLGYKF